MTDSYALIKTYRPNLPDEHWATIAPVVRALALSYATNRNYEAVRATLIALAGFADWVYCTAAAPLAPAALRRDLIEVYEAFRATEVNPNFAAKERKRLLDVAGIPTTREVGRAHSTQTKAVVPLYDAAEVQKLREWANWQPNRISRISATGLVGLGLGCGVRRDELMLIHRKHVRGAGSALSVDVPGRRARRVAVDPEWADELAHAVQATNGYLIAPTGRRRDSLAFSGAFDTARGTAPLPTRLRNTWLRNRVRESHTAPELLRMSGLTSLRSLEDIARTHVPHRADLYKGARSSR